MEQKKLQRLILQSNLDTITDTYTYIYIYGHRGQLHRQQIHAKIQIADTYTEEDRNPTEVKANLDTITGTYF